MPTYEYQCSKCGATFEMFQSITEKPKRKVPPDEKSCACDAPVTRLLGSGSGVIFRGAGFYETDYRSESYKRDAKAEKEKASSAKSSDATKDTKGGKSKNANGGDKHAAA
jgi:putative FmdB family regulatory protein